MIGKVQMQSQFLNVKRKLGKPFQAIYFHRFTLMIIFMGFLLGRAVILEEMSPFAIAYFAVIYHMRRDRLFYVALMLIVGSLMTEIHISLSMLLGFLVFVTLQRSMSRFFSKGELSYTPFYAAISIWVGNLATDFFTGFTLQAVLMTAFEGVLCFVLTLIFVQSLPLFTMAKQKSSLSNEDIVCLMILLASVMTGTVGWFIGPVSVEHIFSQYFILLFALAGGGAIGATVGVVSGLILSLASTEAVYHISLLAFSGLLAGLFREGKRVGVAIGLLLGSMIFSMYMGDVNQVGVTTIESLIAIVLFFLMPKSLHVAIARFIPGTQENIGSQQAYAKRVRDVTASKVQQFSAVFKQLSRSFDQISATNHQEQDEQVNQFLANVSEKTCNQCSKKEKCWSQEFYQTYRMMTDLMTYVEEHEAFPHDAIPHEWRRKCIKAEKVTDVMVQQYAVMKHQLYWKKQVRESKHLVAEQLEGVSQVMEDLAKEIHREGEVLQIQAKQIQSSLEGLGLDIRSVDVINLDEGNVEIEVTKSSCYGRDECSKLVAPLISEIIGENVTIRNKECYGYEDGSCTMLLTSARDFEIETGVAGAAKGGTWISGDSFSLVALGNSKFALAISDGMGNGERAQHESSSTLDLLQQLLQSGIDETRAIKTINSVLMLRSTDEMFATVDLAMIDLHNAYTKFLKVGSTPSFIKRGNDVLTISANNLPIGILSDIEVDLVSEQLQAGDLLIMVTDGIYDAPRHASNKKLWMKRMLLEIESTDPQDVADCLIEKVIRQHQGEIVDDMTVVVAKIVKYVPEWATFSYPGLRKLQRPKKVS